VRNVRRVFFLLVVLLMVIVAAVGYRAIKIKKMHLWIGGYISQILSAPSDMDKISSPRHLMVMFADHFEPAGHVDYVRHWIEEFRRCREKHVDADGRHPQHTFFYPAEQFHDEEMRLLAEICREGYGEIEVQLHHMHDTPASLTEKYRQAIKDFTRYNCLVTASEPPETTFALVHGNWALDNSRILNGSDLCGVNSEITILRELNCYADFTFPAIETSAQPSMINTFFYATDDPEKPKSYDRGAPMEVGKKPSGDLLIMHGILTINWSDWSHIFYPSIEAGTITRETLPTPERVDVWVETNVHVLGQPNWVFVKLYCHGAVRADSLSLWGPEVDTFFDYLETRYNDGKQWVLHYVTAREMFNIAKAAEAGQTGNPADFRDYLIAPYRANFPDSGPSPASSTGF